MISQEQVVDETEDLHDAFVLAQVLVALQQEHVLAAVRAEYADLARPLLRAYDLNVGVERLDAYQRLVGLVRARHGQFEVARHH